MKKHISLFSILFFFGATTLFAQIQIIEQIPPDTIAQSLEIDKPIIIGVNPNASQRQTTISSDIGGVAVGKILGKVAAPTGGAATGVKLYSLSNATKLVDVEKQLVKMGIKQNLIKKMAPKYLELLKSPMTKRVAVLVGATGMAIGVIDLLQNNKEESVFITQNYTIQADESETTLSVLANALVDSSGIDIDDYIKSHSLSSLKLTVAKSPVGNKYKKYLLGGIIGLVVLIIFIILQKKGILN